MFQLAVTHLRIAPSEFWRMKPRHLWWLLEQEKPAKRRISSDDRREFMGWLRGNA